MRQPRPCQSRACLQNRSAHLSLTAGPLLLPQSSGRRRLPGRAACCADQQRGLPHRRHPGHRGRLVALAVVRRTTLGPDPGCHSRPALLRHRPQAVSIPRLCSPVSSWVAWACSDVLARHQPSISPAPAKQLRCPAQHDCAGHPTGGHQRCWQRLQQLLRCTQAELEMFTWLPGTQQLSQSSSH